MPILWNADDLSDIERILRNAQVVMLRAALHARERNTAMISLAQQWHRMLFDGCTLPVAYYAGTVHNSDAQYPELVDYEVRVGARLGVLARDVPKEVEAFEERMQAAVVAIDAQVPRGVAPYTPGILGSTFLLAATAHGEWVRIQPFANGSGCIGRVWGNWVLIRYGLPGVVQLKLRPVGDAYAQAVLHSMSGNHQAMIGVFSIAIQHRLATGVP